MKHTYYASFSANNGSTYTPNGWEYTNKQTALREIRAAVWAEHYQESYNQSTYEVKDETGRTIYAGAVRGFGHWVKFDE